MATKEVKARATRTAAARSRPRSHSKTAAPGAGGVERIQLERRLLHWIFANCGIVQRSLGREAMYCGDNRQLIEMNRCLSLATEFGRLTGLGDTSGIPAHFPNTGQQQRAETQSAEAPNAQSANA